MKIYANSYDWGQFIGKPVWVKYDVWNDYDAYIKIHKIGRNYVYLESLCPAYVNGEPLLWKYQFETYTEYMEFPRRISRIPLTDFKEHYEVIYPIDILTDDELFSLMFDDYVPK